MSRVTFAPPPRALPDVVRGNGVAALGDSITASNAQLSTGITGSGSWLNQSCMASGGRMRYVTNAGISGNTTGQMLARLATDVLAFRPDFCFVLGGTNDFTGLVPQATIRDNLKRIYTGLIGAGIMPIACTLTPRVSNEAERTLLIAWIRWYAQTHGLPLCDFNGVTLDGATGLYLAGQSDDGLHPNQTGVTAMAGKVAADILPIFPPAPPFLERRKITGGPGLVTNPVFTGDANADGVADNWTGVNTASGATASLVADAANVFGNWQQLVVTVSGVKYFDFATATGWAVGDRVAFAGKLTTAGAIAGSLSLSARLRFVGATGTPADLYPVYQLVNDVSNWGWYAETVIPVGTTTVEIQLLVNSGTGTVKWGQVTLVNMTQQGFA